MELTDQNNETEAAFMKAFSPKERSDYGLRLQEAESLSRYRPFLQLPQNNPPRPQAWKDGAYNVFLGRESPRPDDY